MAAIGLAALTLASVPLQFRKNIKNGGNLVSLEGHRLTFRHDYELSHDYVTCMSSDNAHVSLLLALNEKNCCW